jgi:hypothetical protein
VSGFFYRTLACLVCVGLCLVRPVLAEDDYLSILEAEADDTGGHAQETTATSVRSVKEVRSVRDHQIIRPAMSFDEFESELNTFYSGTWFLYEKLNNRQRKTVYGVYQEDNRTAKVRETIVRLLSSR